MFFVFNFTTIIKSTEPNPFTRFKIQNYCDESNLSKNFLSYKDLCYSIENFIEKDLREMLNNLLENVQKQIEDRRIFINAVKENEKLSKNQVKDIIQKLKDGDPNFETIKNCIINQVEKEKEKAKKNISSVIYEIYSNLNIHKNKVLKDLSQFQNWFNGKKQEMQERYKLKDSECIPKLKKSKNIKHHLLKDSMKELTLYEQKPKKVMKKLNFEINQKELFCFENLGYEIEETEHITDINSKSILSKEPQDRISNEHIFLKTEDKNLLGSVISASIAENNIINIKTVEDKEIIKPVNSFKINQERKTGSLYDKFLSLSANIKSKSYKNKILESLKNYNELDEKDFRRLIKDNNIEWEKPGNKKTNFLQQILVKGLPSLDVNAYTILESEWNKIYPILDFEMNKETFAFGFKDINNKNKLSMVHLVSPHLNFDEKTGDVKLGHMIIDNKSIKQKSFNINDETTYSYINQQKWLNKQKIKKEECEISFLNILNFIYHTIPHYEKLFFLDSLNITKETKVESIVFTKLDEQFIYLPCFSLILSNKKIEQLKCFNVYTFS
ncbi:hypothetical protein NUSPORA_01789 [Nucleospora cyclopteri]